MIRFLAVLTALVTLSSPAIAEDLSFDALLGGGAMICDTPEDVLNAFNGTPAPTCGIMQTRSGMSATVTITGEYMDRPLARFDFHNPTPWGNQVQYGWWGGDIPGVTPAGIDV